MEVGQLKFKLDFTIQSSEDRLKAIKDIPLNTLTKTELETISNYILYGKDSDGTSVVDRKEVQIKTKFNSYHKDRTVSLEGLMESPTFDENIFQKEKTIYKKVKPSIDREKTKTVPGMVELWEEIDRLQAIYDQNIEKEEFKEGTPKLNQSELYYLKHQLIDLRTQQYYLLDSAMPTIIGKKNKAEFHGNITDSHLTYPILPRGVMQEENDWNFKEPWNDKKNCAVALNEEEIVQSGKPYFDFRNKEHLYQLIQHYGDLKSQVHNYPDSPINNLLWTLDFYIEKANLTPQQKLIIEDKKFRVPNKTIKIHLEEELNIYHRENYISTIWNKAIGLIIEAVELNYDEFLCKDYERAWKRCNRCGRILLRDSRNFVRKAKSSDGLTNRCKCCDRDIRQGK